MWLQDPSYQGGTLHYNTLNSKNIAYHTQTQFVVQVGRGSKGSYTTRYVIKGNLKKALWYYEGINLGNGYKKRLLMPSCNKNPILLRAKS
jgi:hypothetical protein